MADRAEWPARSGGALRLRTTITALVELGEVDFFAAVAPDSSTSSGHPPLTATRALVVDRARANSRARVAARWPAGRLPRRLLAADATAARRALAAWATPPYDVVWYSPGPTHALLGGVVAGPAIVDLDNLLDRVSRGEREVRAADRRAGHRSPAPPQPRLRSAVASLLDRVDEGRWTRWQRAVAESVDAVAVCSDLDRQRLGAANAVVIPNGYEAATTVGASRTRRAEGSGTRFTMVGRATYAPNLDAAWFFARRVLPAIRASLPTAEFRVVGAHDHRLADLASMNGVTLTGEVVDPAVELTDTDVVVVPVRYGSGTRIKLLEAFAYQLPVVSTSIGCEGLDVADGVHLLVADDSDSFAAACVRLARDTDLRERLAGAAFRLYQQRYRADMVRAAIGGLVRDVVARAERRPAPTP